MDHSCLQASHAHHLRSKLGGCVAVYTYDVFISACAEILEFTMIFKDLEKGRKKILIEILCLVSNSLQSIRCKSCVQMRTLWRTETSWRNQNQNLAGRKRCGIQHAALTSGNDQLEMNWNPLKNGTQKFAGMLRDALNYQSSARPQSSASRRPDSSSQIGR